MIQTLSYVGNVSLSLVFAATRDGRQPVPSPADGIRMAGWRQKHCRAYSLQALLSRRKHVLQLHLCMLGGAWCRGCRPPEEALEEPLLTCQLWRRLAWMTTVPSTAPCCAGASPPPCLLVVPALMVLRRDREAATRSREICSVPMRTMVSSS